jgi:uncharacterized protein YkwD
MSAKIKSRPHQTSIRHRHKPKGISGHTFEKVYWPYIPLLIFALTLMGFAVHNGLLKPILKHPTQNVLSYATKLSQQELLVDTNNARSANGQRPLKINTQLVQAAQAKANDMALRNYWSHNTPAGNPPWVFVSGAGYQYDKIGENLAAGFTDTQATINGWMASPEHRENMLDSAFSEVGFGFTNNPNYTSTGQGGPMTIVVAFYGEPVQAISALDKSNGISLAAASSNLSSQPPATTARAQVALAGLPFAADAGIAVSVGFITVCLLWATRHILAMRRAVTRGERFVMSHPLFDLGLLLIGFILFALSRTAGFVG